jgi:nucleoside-diphosphate-sugar epimerase
MTERILVTGASGFIGSHLIPSLTKRGYEVLTHSHHEGDIARDRLNLPKVRHVFHLAARNFVPEAWKDPVPVYRTNVIGTVNVLEFCRSRGASLTLLSSYVYGQPKWLPIGEDHPLQAFNPYSHSKILSEEVCQYYRQQFDLSIAIVRAFNVYGPGQRRDFLIPLLLEQALDPECEIISVADLRPKRDHLNVSDLVELLCVLAERRVTGIYNAGTGISYSVAEIVDMIWTAGVKPKPVKSQDQSRPAEVLEVVADITKAKNELGWIPKVTLPNGIAAMVASLSNRG